jgi:RNA polymerase sigma-70 factor (ECF subfamily)
VTPAEEFEQLRPLLFSIAYRILGSVSEAEDAVQETWLRYAAAPNAPDSTRAFLSTVVTRISIDVLRSARVRREAYVGPWFPEPLLSDPYSDPERSAELADSLSMAALLLLERLSPLERAVFVLREVFDVPYEEIAAALEKTEAAVRQTAHRARRHVADRRPRVKVDRSEQQRVVEQFLAALASGDMQGLMEVLAPDVVVVADGGGLVAAARHPISGAERVVAFLSKFAVLAPSAVVDTLWINGAPGGRIVLDGEVNTVISFVLEEGRITRMYAVRNPHKLGALVQEAALTR